MNSTEQLRKTAMEHVGEDASPFIKNLIAGADDDTLFYALESIGLAKATYCKMLTADQVLDDAMARYYENGGKAVEK